MPAANNILPFVFESVILFQIVYIALQWLYIRKVEYLYYLGYMLVMGLYVYVLYMPFSAENHHPPVLDKTLPMLGYLLYYKFARSFADMHLVLPKLNDWMKRFEYFLGIYIIFEVFIRIFEFNVNISEYVFLFVSGILFLFTFVFIYIFLQAKIRLTYFLIAGAAMLNIGSFGTMWLHVMMTKGEFDAFDPFWLFAAATILDLVAFTTGLAYKSKLAVQDSLKIQIEYNSKLNQNILLSQQLHEIKDNLAQRLHSDLITALSNINIYAGLAKREMSSGDNNRILQHLNKISQAGTAEIQHINDLVWCINPENNAVEHLKNKIMAIWVEGDSSAPIHVTIPEDCTIIFDTTLLVKILGMIRKMRGNATESHPSLSVICDAAYFFIEINFSVEDIFYQESLGKYLHSVERLGGKTILKITTIRD